MMPKKSQSEKVQCRYFAWRIRQKKFDVWYADGRSNGLNLARHSLGTKIKEEAVERLHLLDARTAVKHKLADPSILEDQTEGLVTIRQGSAMYLKHVGRPKVARGASKKTVQRYQAVLDKFADFAEGEGVSCWRWVSRRLVEEYAGWLEDHDYAYRSQYLELTVIKTVLKWLAVENHIPQHCLFPMSLAKPTGSPTYAYTDVEVAAIVRYCEGRRDLQWLGRVVCTLAYTGMRVGEAAQLEWDDVDLDDWIIHVRDEQRGASNKDEDEARSTKGKRSRIVPIHRHLRPMFDSLSKVKQGQMFYGPRGGKLKPDVVRTVLVRDVLPAVARQLYPKQARPKMLRGRVHSFRHFFATMAYRAGLPERTILDIMGHRSSEITRLYRHLSQDEYRKAVDQLPGLADLPEEDSGDSPEDNYVG